MSQCINGYGYSDNAEGIAEDGRWENTERSQCHVGTIFLFQDNNNNRGIVDCGWQNVIAATPTDSRDRGFKPVANNRIQH